MYSPSLQTYISVVSPVCLRNGVITPVPEGCAANALANLHSAKNGKLRYDWRVGFSDRSFCTHSGRQSGVTKLERWGSGTHSGILHALII